MWYISGNYKYSFYRTGIKLLFPSNNIHSGKRKEYYTITSWPFQSKTRIFVNLTQKFRTCTSSFLKKLLIRKTFTVYVFMNLFPKLSTIIKQTFKNNAYQLTHPKNFIKYIEALSNRIHAILTHHHEIVEIIKSLKSNSTGYIYPNNSLLHLKHAKRLDLTWAN